MLKPEKEFERLVEIVYKLDDKDWYTWYLDESMQNTLIELLKKHIVLSDVDFTRGMIYRIIWDSTNELTICIAQDITSCVKEIIEDNYLEYCHECEGIHGAGLQQKVKMGSHGGGRGRLAAAVQ